MKKVFNIVVLIVVAGAVGGYVFWQYNKKKMVKDSIENALAKKTDSLYYLHYDSSRIDEINGNATFYNVVLQSDAAQKELLNSKDSLPNALYNIRINKVMVTGVDIAGLLQKRNVAAKKIELIKPVIQIINTGADRPRPFTINDTMELYQKILGKFKSIQADVIQVTNGTLLLTNKTGKAQTTFENINITLNHFLVNDKKDYESIVSYFIKEVRATVEIIQLPASKNDTRINLEKVDYNAAERYLHIAAIRQYKVNNMDPVTDLKNIRVSELNTDAFILQQRLKAGLISCDGGVVTIYVKKNSGKSKGSGGQSMELSTDIIDQAQIAGIHLGSTKVIIADRNLPGDPPFVLNNAHFKLTKMLKIAEGTTVNNMINNAEWELSADGFSFTTITKMYKVSVGDFIINNATSSAKIKSVVLKPLLSETQFAKRMRYQADQYNLTVLNIILSGVDIKRLISNQELQVQNASFQPNLKIFNDRNFPSDGKSKIGNYPHQSILKLSFPIHIRTTKISNGFLSYREKAIKSKLTGNVFFSDINATLQNVTNIRERINANAILTLNATAKFLGTANLITEWQLPLNAANGAFGITGRLADMNAVTLNPVIEPLAMASIKEGRIDEVKFAVDGTDTKATGNILFLYHNLKVDLLKKQDDKTLQKKGLVSVLANTIIKNKNTDRSKNEIIKYEREITKSFFNLVWKTIFAGAKKTAL